MGSTRALDWMFASTSWRWTRGHQRAMRLVQTVGELSKYRYIYLEEGNNLSSRKKISPWMWKRGTVKEKGEGPAPGMDAAETRWVSGFDFDFSVS